MTVEDMEESTDMNKFDLDRKDAEGYFGVDAREDTPLLQRNHSYNALNDTADSLVSLLFSRSIVLSGASFKHSQASAQTTNTNASAGTISLPDKPSLDRLASTPSTFCSSMCMVLGLALYTMPALVSTGGIAILVLIVLLGLLSWYTTRLLLVCQRQRSKTIDDLDKRVYENYMEMGVESMQPYGHFLMQILIITSSLADIYTLIFCAQVSLDLLGKIIKLSKPMWILLWGLVSIPTYFIRRMSTLAWFGIIAMSIYVIVLLTSFTLIALETKQWTMLELVHTFSWESFFISYGVIANSYCIHLAAPAIEASMKKESHAKPMFKILFITNVIIKILFASIGALAFGPNCQDTITSNLSEGQYAFLARFINIGMAVYLFFELPLIMFVVFETCDLTFLPHFHLFNRSKVGTWAWIVLSRVTLAMSLIFVAVCLPRLELVISLIGTVRGTLISFVAPLYFYIKLRFRKLSTLSLVFHMFLLILVTFAGLSGMWVSIKDLIFD